MMQMYVVSVMEGHRKLYPCEKHFARAPLTAVLQYMH